MEEQVKKPRLKIVSKFKKLNKRAKRIILVSGLLLLVLIGATVITNVMNNKKEVAKDTYILRANDVTTTEGEMIITLSANIKNIGVKPFEGQMVQLVLIGKNGKELGTVDVYITDIAVDESIRLETVIDKSFVNTATVEIRSGTQD